VPACVSDPPGGFSMASGSDAPSAMPGSLSGVLVHPSLATSVPVPAAAPTGESRPHTIL
jgi:hypothetical protein